MSRKGLIHSRARTARVFSKKSNRTRFPGILFFTKVISFEIEKSNKYFCGEQTLFKKSRTSKLENVNNFSCIFSNIVKPEMLIIPVITLRDFGKYFHPSSQKNMFLFARDEFFSLVFCNMPGNRACMRFYLQFYRNCR